MLKRLLTVSAIAVALAASAAQAQAAKDTLTIDLPQDAATLDPQLQWNTDSYTIYRNIFDNLVTRDTAGKIEPQIATAWKYVDDKTIDFTIRSDVKFQDGSRLTADDVAFSIKRIIDPALKSPQLSQFNQIADAKVLGPTKVEVTTKSPYPALLAQLVKLSIVPKAYVQKVGDEQFNAKPIGSGPYALVNWQHGVQTTLKANTDYWGRKPPFKTVVFRAVPDVSTRIADLRTGKADLITELPPDQAVNLKSASGIQILSVPTERVGYLYINAQAGPTKDLRVRQAIAYAIDRKGLVISSSKATASRSASSGRRPCSAIPTRSRAIPTTRPRPRRFSRKPGSGRQARVPDIAGLRPDAGPGDPADAQRRRPRHADRHAGPGDLPQAPAGRSGEPGSVAIGRWSCACQDADGIIFPLFHTGSTWAKYSNPKFDALVEDARSTLDRKKRLEDYRKAYEILREDVPGIGLYQVYAIYGASSHLQWQPTANESVRRPNELEIGGRGPAC